ncbi:MAG: biotin transporter BioY [Rhodobacteraceae bacterium]|nr:biotin transporter BioY [Paracoccaceae bacterium]
MTTTTLHPVLSDVFWRAEANQIWVKRLVLLVTGVAALWLSAKIQIATVAVPVTLQMLVIMVIGAAYGPRLAAATVASYIVLGMQGLPVFAGTPEKGIGMAYVMGPTGGYILGFLIAAYAVGLLARAGWDRSPIKMAAAMGVGILCVYVPGVIWLCAGFSLLGGGAEGAFTGYGWANWYAYGVKTFIWVDALKLVLAVIAFPTLWRLVGNARL